MGDLLDTLLDIGDIYERYGIRGCLLSILTVVLLIGIILGIAWMMQ